MLTAQENQTRTFTVAAHPRVVVQNRAGHIRVTRGNENTVEVHTTIHADWMGRCPEVRMETIENQTVLISVHAPIACLGSSHVDIEVRVPSTADLDLNSNAGNIDVRNVYGQLKLRTNAGSLTALYTTLTESASFQTNAGSIRFLGTIDTRADYSFQTNAGSIDLTLPAHSSLQVEACTNVGAINTNFPLQVERWIPGTRAHGITGSEPQARINLRTNAGSISLHKGSVE